MRGFAVKISQQDRAVIVVHDSQERREINQLVRNELRQQGRLGRETRSVPISAQQDFGNRRLAANYSPGDQIHFKKGRTVRSRQVSILSIRLELAISTRYWRDLPNSFHFLGRKSPRASTAPVFFASHLCGPFPPATPTPDNHCALTRTKLEAKPR